MRVCSCVCACVLCVGVCVCSCVFVRVRVRVRAVCVFVFVCARVSPSLEHAQARPVHARAAGQRGRAAEALAAILL